MNNKDFLDSLYENGVRFSVSYKSECGETTLFLSPDDLLLYQKSPEIVIAQRSGVTVADFHNWKGENFNVQCSAKTRKGTRCKNIVTGGYMVDLKTWASLSGHYCETHEKWANVSAMDL
ncbi:hypothetical protein DC847_RS23515 [Vibrio parahaemolyticus]|nr:hypothetical protein [Vibrio parahaemolyticus]EGQ8893080.1 hypothetical protein [Vibrio parahaemolyticus]EGQ8967170.1 hypothetical protein [Vibrio parahaemolyticus]EGR2854721.1 hypothetical protein [Vibrio parahaemolyticus]EGR3169530.1 hypothetical protein [Vibrio parahaemolyticus]